MSPLKNYLWGQRWNILLTTQLIFTCGIVAKRYQENQAKNAVGVSQTRTQPKVLKDQ